MPRRLTRDTTNAMLGGVAAGLGEYFGVDPVLVRLGFVLLAFMDGIGPLGYVVCWVIMPRKDEPEAAPGERRSRVIAGAILIVLGAVFLLDRIGSWHWPAWMRPGSLWPVILMAIGASIIWRALRGTKA